MVSQSDRMIEVAVEDVDKSSHSCGGVPGSTMSEPRGVDDCAISIGVGVDEGRLHPLSMKGHEPVTLSEC